MSDRRNDALSPYFRILFYWAGFPGVGIIKKVNSYREDTNSPFLCHGFQLLQNLLEILRQGGEQQHRAGEQVGD